VQNLKNGLIKLAKGAAPMGRLGHHYQDDSSRHYGALAAASCEDGNANLSPSKYYYETPPTQGVRILRDGRPEPGRLDWTSSMWFLHLDYGCREERDCQ